MKKMLKNTYLLVVAVALTFVACKDAQPKVDTKLLEKMAQGREKMAVADAYYHGDVYATGDVSYKVTLTLLAEGMDFVYDDTKANYALKSFSGTGYAFEIEFNSSSADAIAPGVYRADTLDVNDEFYMYEPFTYNPKNTYLTVVNNGSNTKNELDGNVTIDVKASGDVYTITISGKNAINMPVKGVYQGKIKARNITYYRSSEIAKDMEVQVVKASYSADETNKATYAYYANEGYADHFESVHYITAEGKNGEVMKIELLAGNMDWYSIADGDYAMEDGFWNLLDNKGKYNTALNYRTGAKLSGSYMLYNNELYYLAGGSLHVEFEGTLITKLTVNAKSAASGAVITVNYTKAS